MISITKQDGDDRFNRSLFSALHKAFVLSVTLAALGLSMPARAIDVDAAEYQPVPPGTNLALLYYQHVDRNQLYSGGQRVPGDNRLDSDIGIFRYLHYMNVGGFLTAPEILVPFGRLDAHGATSSLGNASGAGDVILGLPTWLLNDADHQQYFAVTPFLIAPTGSYDKNSALNLGNNRWQYTLQFGYLAGITQKLFLNLTGDVSFFGANNDFGPRSQTLRQDPLYELQVAVHYKVTDTLDLRAGYAHFWGGQTKVDGVDQHNASQQQKFYVGAAWFFNPTTQILTTWGRDISVANGFKETNRINLRLLKAF
ncbi:hypothetical protein PTE30175_04060 [Pandoraea terrae]|uniref:Transporter n=1 Tax=Pandoraea terrae TaxID=1537710 RepID=A0A5E4XXD6_9BURK|nr:transporter [Pandoraea terrae]VVE41036.1 hypothetical protein PTE30175_04060 [Pandoraea terrae]